MAIKGLNFKFISLFLIYVFFGVLSRVLFTQTDFDKEYLYFLAGITATPMVFYLLVGLNTNLHTIKNLMSLILCNVLLQFFIKEGIDKYYIALNIGFLLSTILIGITFVKKINKWFLE
ncbi:MAG: hypothetical protein PHT07_18155 [Paludibacter sp.]|nr:hypothetical protein [Paludibacter sp.]